MTIVSHSRTRAGRQGQTRRGAVLTGWLVVFCLLFIVMLWAAEWLSLHSHARVELQNADDAAAHAAARDLVTESVFKLPYLEGTSAVPIDRNGLIATARADGERLGRLNRVMGKPLNVVDNAQNQTDGDLYAGTLDNPTSRTFIGLTNTGFDAYNPDLNAVRVKTRMAKVAASATYYVDRDVIGFRLKPPPNSSPTFPALPLVPIAILSEPCLPGQNTPAGWATKDFSSWERAVMARAGLDKWSIGPSGVPVNVGDGIREISVTLTEGGNSGDNAQLVYFNPAEGFGSLAGQVTNGIVYGDLAATDWQQAGQFLLNDGTQNQNVVPAATGALPPASSPSLSQGGALTLAGSIQNQTGLLGILGQARVWMLYSGLSTHNGNPTVNVVGFVVARVMSVQTAAAGTAGNSLTIVLQPSVLVTDKAVTNWTLRNAGPRSLYNPYLARLRFVE